MRSDDDTITLILVGSNEDITLCNISSIFIVLGWSMILM